MPTRKFTRATIKWRDCEHCGNDFPLSRKDRRHCGRQCKESARRLRKREGAIQASGGRCGKCGKVYDPEHPTRFFVLKDGSVLCGRDLSRRANSTFWKRWPKGKKGYRSQKGVKTAYRG